MLQKEYAKSITRYVKNKKHHKTLVWTHVLYIHSSFILCFTSAQYGHYRRHGQHQASVRIPPKCISACRGPPCGLQLIFDLSCYQYMLEVVEHKRGL